MPNIHIITYKRTHMNKTIVRFHMMKLLELRGNRTHAHFSKPSTSTSKHAYTCSYPKDAVNGDASTHMEQITLLPRFNDDDDNDDDEEGLTSPSNLAPIAFNPIIQREVDALQPRPRGRRRSKCRFIFTLTLRRARWKALRHRWKALRHHRWQALRHRCTLRRARLQALRHRWQAFVRGVTAHAMQDKLLWQERRHRWQAFVRGVRAHAMQDKLLWQERRHRWQALVRDKLLWQERLHRRCRLCRSLRSVGASSLEASLLPL